MNSRTVIYKHVPSTSELAQRLNPPKTITRADRLNRLLLAVTIFATTVAVGCGLLIKGAWLPKQGTGLVGLSFLSIALLAWIVSVVTDIAQGAGTLLNPAKELAEQFDRDVAMERQLLPCLQAIPAAILMARHQKLELQLFAWEKWLDIARLMGLLGPPLIFIGKATFGRLISSGDVWNIEIIVSAFLTGVLIGSISFRSGMKRLHRVSSLLKHAGEQRQATVQKRRMAKHR